ncbi:hypothetical protein HanIR_Chr08g0371381 [Helianthus annuus]|nr:hypothetical protein HanIR_Chr08g0371381 [Helianthus annuus]
MCILRKKKINAFYGKRTSKSNSLVSHCVVFKIQKIILRVCLAKLFETTY